MMKLISAVLQSNLQDNNILLKILIDKVIEFHNYLLQNKDQPNYIELRIKFNFNLNDFLYACLSKSESILQANDTQ